MEYASNYPAPYSYVAEGLMNSLLANRHICEHAEEVGRLMDERVSVKGQGSQSYLRMLTSEMNRGRFGATQGLLLPTYLAKTVDYFMAKHPRGKGTKDSDALRKFYAACYTIKLAQSRPSQQKNAEARRGRVNDMTATQLQVILRFDADGQPLDRVALKGIRADTLLRLYDLGLLNGLWLDDKPESFWLTDRGLRLHKEVSANKARNDAEIEKRKTMSLVDQMLKHHNDCLVSTTDPTLREFHERAAAYLRFARAR